MRKFAAGVATAGLVFALLAVPRTGTAEVADCGRPPKPLVSVSVDRAGTAAGLRTTVGITKTRTLTVRAELRCGGPVEFGQVGVAAVLGDSLQGPSVLLRPTNPGSPNLVSGSLTVKPSDLDNSMAGLVPVTFRAGEIGADEITHDHVISKVYQEMVVSTVHIYRAARLTIKVSPKRVAVGRAVTVTGRLTRADWDSGVYTGYARRPVVLAYHRGVGGCERYKTVLSGPDGRIRTTFKPNLDLGPLTWTFDGNSTTGRVQSPAVLVETTEPEPCL